MTVLSREKLGTASDLGAPRARGQSLAATASKSLRIPALDFTKGALVLIMVLYHWLNYFLGASDNRYLRFLTPSFICITGFLISNVYLSRYGVTDPQLPKRLMQRGLKILGVFAALNLARVGLFPKTYGTQMLSEHSSIRSLLDIYVIGSNLGGGQEKAIAFFILVPIAYLLLLSALLLVFLKTYRYVFHASCIFSFLAILVLYFNGYESANLELLAIGLAGVMLGYMPIERINAYVNHPYLLTVAYCCYLAAITIWNIIYPLQVVGVFLSLAIIYLLGSVRGEPGRIRGLLLLLGKYSLFGYIAQIAILQFLRRGFEHMSGGPMVLGLSFVLAIILTSASVEALDYGRSKSVATDKLYKAVFA